MATKRRIDTWKKIFELGSSDSELDFAYAQILATAMDIRIKSGITQSELSRKTGLSTSIISKIESQNSVPTLKTFLKYMQGLDLNWEFTSSKKES